MNPPLSAASLAELTARGDLALLDKAQAERIAVSDDRSVWGEP